MSEALLKDGIPYHIDKSSNMKPFWNGLNDKKLMTTSCEKCSAVHFPPTPQLCTKCFSTKIMWKELPLTGTINTWTKVTAPPEGFSGEYILASVVVDELEKAILGRYLGGTPETGQRVKISFQLVKDQYVLVFE